MHKQPLQKNKRNMEELKKELEQLKADFGTPEFDIGLEVMKGKYVSDEEKKLISECVLSLLDKVGEDIKTIKTELNVLEAVKGISDMISFKYIAEKYFHKSKSWFSQRLNGNNVHGKPCKFSDEELEILRFALQDISKKIGSLSI